MNSPSIKPMRPTQLFIRFISQLIVSVIMVFAGFYFMNVVVPGPGGYILEDLYPAWYGVHAVVDGRSPYTAQATHEIQSAMPEALQLKPINEQRFAYPLFAVAPMMPLAFLTFPTALKVCLWLGVLLTIATIWLWYRCLHYDFNFLGCAVILATPLVTYPIMMRQPSVLFIFLLALTCYLIRSNHYVLAGAIAALASAKPQLAIFVIALLASLTFVDWKSRKAFIFSYGGSLVALLAFSFAVQPSWFVQWLTALKAYQRYGSIFEYYNAPLLIPIALWFWKNRRDILPGPFYRELFFLVPSAVLIAGYASVFLSCFFRVLMPWAILFFHRAALVLAIEAPFVLYAIKRKLPRSFDPAVATENPAAATS